jgi:threonine/homoserine/homoserine lactone efflux protein
MIDDANGELAELDGDRDKADAEREEYLRRQQQVRAQSTKSTWTPLRVVGWVAYAVALGFFVAFIVQVLNESDPNAGASLVLPTVAIAFCVIGLWCALGPVLAESRSRGRRIRNLIIAAVATVVVGGLLVPVIASFGGLIADLLSNFV